MSPTGWTVGADVGGATGLAVGALLVGCGVTEAGVGSATGLTVGVREGTAEDSFVVGSRVGGTDDAEEGWQLNSSERGACDSVQAVDKIQSENTLIRT
jgi:hypothetical protein